MSIEKARAYAAAFTISSITFFASPKTSFIGIVRIARERPGAALHVHSMALRHVLHDRFRRRDNACLVRARFSRYSDVHAGVMA
nr:hypothetical protein [Caballeronia choica]